MAFDMGWDFRATAGYVTDDAHYGVFAKGDTDAYPTTYTNGDGQSLNAGWTTLGPGATDASASNDPRIAGGVYVDQSGGSRTFQIDLSSGSAPGAGTYTVDCAFGRADYNPSGQTFQVKDNTTVVLDGTNGGAGYSVATGHYIDATLQDVAATTTWTGATTSKAFSSTTANLVLSTTNNSNYTIVAHFRLTLQGGGAAASTLHSLMLLGVGV